MCENDDDSEHMRRLEDRNVPWLGELEGIAVSAGEEYPLLFLHGTDRSCAVEVRDESLVDAMARAGVEIEAVMDGVIDTYEYPSDMGDDQ